MLDAELPEVCYKSARFGSLSFDESTKLYYRAAMLGHAKSQSEIGVRLFKGLLARDDVEMIKWFRLAAEGGDARGLCELGRCYMLGRGISPDIDEAIRLYKIASDKGYSAASSLIGSCYRRGFGVSKNDDEAEKWFAKANNQKAVEIVADFREQIENASGPQAAKSMIYLGKCYAYGCGVEQDFKLANEWYHKAIDEYSGIAGLALYHIAMIYIPWLSDIDIGTFEDVNEGIKYLHKAAEHGHAEAMYQLGCCYAVGRGVVKNEKESTQWFRQATKQKFIKDISSTTSLEEQ